MTPTTRHCRRAKVMAAPRPAFSKPWAMPLPTTISEPPGWNMRPLMSRTWGRRLKARGLVPRTVTCPGPAPPRLGRLINDTTSRRARVCPVASWAISGWLSATEACPGVRMDCISAWAERRRAMTLSGLPVETRVSLRPWASMSTAAKTKTTRAMPVAVRKVVSRRTHRLRRL